MEFKLPYWLRNQGDGSAMLIPERSLEIARKRCDSQPEGWGENSADVLILKVDEGKLFYRGYVDGWQWVEVERIEDIPHTVGL